MAKYVTCDACGGAIIRGETDGELINKVQEHDKQAHDRETTRAQVLLLAKKER